MMSSSRWDPWGEIVSLRDAMNNLLEESFVRPRVGTATGLGLAVDLLETPDAYVLIASVPGVKPEDVSITVLGETIRMSGRRSEASDGRTLAKEGRWLIQERHFGDFERTVHLPSAVKTDEASAEFEDGVVTITLPKADEAKPRTIAVRTAESARTPREIDVTSGRDA